MAAGNALEGVSPFARARLNGNRHPELVAGPLPVRTPLHRRGAGSVI
jgi:hypothetical protein